MKITINNNSFIENGVIVHLNGTIPGGSEGNKIVKECVEKVQSEISTFKNVTNIIFDLLNIDYDFGDSIGELWLVFMMRGTDCILVAKEKTYIALNELLLHSIPIPLFTTINEAIKHQTNNKRGS